jgi:hypothetical protein
LLACLALWVRWVRLPLDLGFRLGGVLLSSLGLGLGRVGLGMAGLLLGGLLGGLLLGLRLGGVLLGGRLLAGLLFSRVPSLSLRLGRRALLVLSTGGLLLGLRLRGVSGLGLPPLCVTGLGLGGLLGARPLLRRALGLLLGVLRLLLSLDLSRVGGFGLLALGVPRPGLGRPLGGGLLLSSVLLGGALLGGPRGVFRPLGLLRVRLGGAQRRGFLLPGLRLARLLGLKLSGVLLRLPCGERLALGGLLLSLGGLRRMLGGGLLFGELARPRLIARDLSGGRPVRRPQARRRQGRPTSRPL